MMRMHSLASKFFVSLPHLKRVQLFEYSDGGMATLLSSKLLMALWSCKRTDGVDNKNFDALIQNDIG